MDYGALLYKAHENNKNATNKEVRCYKASFTAPKKLERSKVSSDSIKKFLARKEEEEKKHQMVESKKKEELLALRSQDKKAQRRVQVMLKSTKSANKSVMEDAIDNCNTADTLNGFKQCDEDDYGYVSQEASAFYTKLLTKYEKMPADQLFSTKHKKEVKDLNAAKDRVKAALRKEEEEEMMPHKRKRKKHDKDQEKESSEEPRKEEKKDESREADKSTFNKVKRKNLAPPPLNFDQLLQIASKKQFEPIVIDDVKVKKEPERLMTKKEKAEFEKEEERKLNKGKRPPPTPSSDEPPQEKLQKKSATKTDTLEQKKSSKYATDGVESKLNQDNKRDRKKTEGKDSQSKGTVTIIKTSQNDIIAEKDPSSSSKNKLPTTEKVVDRLKKDSTCWAKSTHGNLLKPSSKMKSSDILKTKPSSNDNGKLFQKVNMESKKVRIDPKIEKAKTLSDLDKEIELMKQKRELLASKVRLQELKLLKSKMEEKKSLSEKPKARAMIEKKKPTPKSRRIDSESEHDSELDDFIDDGPEDEGNDYSKYISEIFGYDKSKYSNADEEDECMESNFAQQMREEFVSTKIGIMEDLEDIRKEQEEKKRHKQKKKQAEKKVK